MKSCGELLIGETGEINMMIMQDYINPGLNMILS